MRWWVVGCGVTLGLFVASAALADGRPKRTAWTGLYIGFNGGHAWSVGDTVDIDETQAGALFFSGSFGTLRPAGAFGGYQYGGNTQVGGIVIGFESDLQLSDIADDASATLPYLTGTMTVTSRKTIQVFGTGRLRAGVLAGERTLLYATGGIAWGRVKHSIAMSDSFGFVATDSRTRSPAGYVVGGGVEYVYSPRFTVKLEYQYINLGSEEYRATETFGGAPTAFAISTRNETEFHTLRFGLNYKYY
jgi:outer membrane immunogenic protein